MVALKQRLVCVEADRRIERRREMARLTVDAYHEYIYFIRSEMTSLRSNFLTKIIIPCKVFPLLW